MCGIVGIFNGGDDRESQLLAALQTIAHRGTTQNEYAIFPKTVLGANRLPIVAAEDGAQPRFNENRTVTAVMNGEIFNHRKLHDHLTKVGHDLRGECDTEVLTHLYEEYGPACVNHIDSEMFAFIIYDTRNNIFFAARDRLGVKPLYYAKTDEGIFYIASEIKALTIFPKIKHIHEFPAGYTCRNGIFESYSLGDSKDSLVNVAFESAKAQLKACLIDAVIKRLPQSEPVAVLLSGGVDSALIMAIAEQHHENVTAFILGTLHSQDRIFAEKLCREKNWKYEVIDAEIDYEHALPDIVYFAESFEPNIIRHCFASNLVCRAIHMRG